MNRGRTRKGRERATRALLELPTARPLVDGVDHGPSVRLDGSKLGVAGDGWIEPFLAANRPQLQRLGITATVEARSQGVALKLKPSSRIGAVPLLSPATRRVVAGLLIRPRFHWSALGSVLGEVGFEIEPNLGGGPMVPGSAREVPVWMLAAPVIRRLDAMLSHRKRGFVIRSERRQSPRGRVDWSQWASRDVPAGRWTTLPCQFPDPDDDPELLAAVRWTLAHLEIDLAPFRGSSPGRLLLARIADLLAQVGPGNVRRPSSWELPNSSSWVAEGLQAMGWVAEERGLGGSRSLDGMSWDLAVDQVWEAWVDRFVDDLGPRCGLSALRRGHTHRRLNWNGSIQSMRALIPDSGLRGPGRVVWVDAKYKRHLSMLARTGWPGLGQSTRDAHRADLHQALAYASLEDVECVDSLLVYPEPSGSSPLPPAIATVASGRRSVRLILIGLPFGFTSHAERERALLDWRTLLMGHSE